MRMPTTLRILCLHGFTSNGTIHAHQARKITALFSNPSSSNSNGNSTTTPKYEFLFPDGPHIVADTDIKDTTWHNYVSTNSTQGHRAWWFARDSNFTNPNSFVNPETGGYYGLEESIQYLGELIAEKGPVHAIWGFSQGACIAGMLVAMASDPDQGRDPLGLRKLLSVGEKDVLGTVKAGVFFGGFKARFEQYAPLYDGGVKLPTLHVMGENDVLVTPERSEKLVSLCDGAEVLRHQNGHNLPREAAEVERIAEFLRKNVKEAD
jgi:hypothetical protein